MRSVAAAALAALALPLTPPSLDAGAGAAPAAPASSPGTIRTAAGGGVGDGRAAGRAILISPFGVAAGTSGDLYIVDQNESRVRRVHHGIMTTMAGTGDTGSAGDGGPATAATFELPWGVAVDGAGTVYVSDWSAGSIRRIDGRGVISTLASHLVDPAGLALSADGGRLFVAETGTDRVLAITTADGSQTTVAGIAGVAGYTGDGMPATESALSSPLGVAVDITGGLDIVDTGNALLRRVSLSSGLITTILGRANTTDTLGVSGPDPVLHAPTSMAVDGHGTVYVADYDPSEERGVVLAVVRDGSPGAARVVDPILAWGLAASPRGQLYASEQDAGCPACVTEVHTGAVVAGTADALGDLAADGQPATTAHLLQPSGVARDPRGGVDVVDGSQAIRVDASGTAHTVAGDGRLALRPGDPGGQPARRVHLEPTSIATDAAGDVDLYDAATHRIVEVDLRGVLHDLVGSGRRGGRGIGAGMPARSVDASGTTALLVAPDGSLYVADAGGSVYRVDRRGIVTVVAGGDGAACTAAAPLRSGPATQACLDAPDGLAMDAHGNLYIAESGADLVDEVSPAGTIRVVAGIGRATDTGDGGPAAAASLSAPHGLALDAAGDLFIADTGNAVVRCVDSAGTITTVAGTAPAARLTGAASRTAGGAAPQRGDGGPAVGALLVSPVAVAVGANGDLFIADASDGRIREVAGIANATGAARSRAPHPGPR